MQIIEGNLSLLGDEKIAIISSRFNHLITDRLVEGAKDCFLRHGGREENLTHILVPGAFEIPFALEKSLHKEIMMAFAAWAQLYVVRHRILIM